MKKILIAGGNGNLAKELIKVLGEKHDVYSLSHESLDITEQQQVYQVVSRIRPDFIINTAALTDVDGCERNISQAINVNGLGPLYLALACKHYQSVLIHFSTEMIFDGLKTTPYTEKDTPNPLSAYGISKYVGEQNVKRSGVSYGIFRTSWLFGGDTPKFVTKIIQKAKVESQIQVASDQFGSPTYISDIALSLEQYIKEPKFGTFHLTNSGKASRLDMAHLILNTLSFDCKLLPTAYDKLQVDTYRPPHAVLTSSYKDDYSFLLLRPWQEALQEYLYTLKL